MHNSWDDSNGQRHAVPLAAMRAFVERHASGGAAHGATGPREAAEDELGEHAAEDASEDVPLAKRLAARLATSS